MLELKIYNGIEILNQIRLRGHHLNMLWKFIVCYDNDKNCLKHDSEEYEIFINACIRTGYSKYFSDQAFNLLKKIVEEDVKVELTNDLDDICSLCNQRHEFCYSKTLSLADVNTLNYYGLKLGMIYNSKTVNEEIKEKDEPCPKSIKYPTQKKFISRQKNVATPTIKYSLRKAKYK
jgi:hypothetical protein